MATARSRTGVLLWTPGDWNALFGLGTNVLVNLLVLTGLLKFVVGMPDEITFGRILPAVGLMLFMGNMYYAFMGWKLARKTGRDDVCALPSGPSVPHMFIVVFVIMLPILGQTGDPLKAWEAGLAWVFLQGFILIGGAFVAPHIRRITPRAALLGVTCLAIIMAGWFGGVRYPRNLPAGLVAIVTGMVIAWGATFLGFPEVGGMSFAGLASSFASFGFSIPLPAVDHVFSGFEFLGFILVTAIPFGVYDLVEAMDNVESAEAAGDSYSTTEAIVAEGSISLIGTLLGSCFANAVYIGHPGWKSMGGRIGYSAATGVFVLALAWLGIIAVFLNLVPVVAIAPILLYIGMLIGAQAFQTTPASHAPAIVLGLVPHLAAWAKVLIDGALGAAGVAVDEALIAGMATNGVLYEGLAILGNGAILTGLVLAAIGVFVIERRFMEAALFAAAGAVLTFFGFMHGPAVGIAVTPMVAFSYAMVAGLLYLAHRNGMAQAPLAVPEPVAAE